MKRLAPALFLFLLLYTQFPTLKGDAAVTDGMVRIRADGAIIPETVPIFTSDNLTYTFLGDISASISVERDNVTLNGNGHTLSGAGTGYGLRIYGLRNVTVKNTRIQGFSYGTYVLSSSGCMVSDSTITDNREGVFLDSSFDCAVSGNMLNNQVRSAICCHSSFENTISENNVSYSEFGLLISSASTNNSILMNRIENTHVGIEFESSDSNNVLRNNVRNNVNSGISLMFSSFNLISLNNIIGSGDEGIYMAAENNTISGNNIENNQKCGIFVSSSHNRVYNNNFINNTEQIKPGDYTNYWDADKAQGGNYWDNCPAVDLNSDGIADSPFNIDTDKTAIDNYPLMGPFSYFDVSTGITVYVVSNSTIDDLEYYGTNETLRMTLSDKTMDQTYGFLRLTLPSGQLPPPYDIEVNDERIPYANIYQNDEVTTIYFSYKDSKLEITLSRGENVWVLFAFTLMTILVITLILLALYRKTRSAPNKLHRRIPLSQLSFVFDM